MAALLSNVESQLQSPGWDLRDCCEDCKGDKGESLTNQKIIFDIGESFAFNE